MATAKEWIVEWHNGSDWVLLPTAISGLVTHNTGAMPNSAYIEIKSTRWNDQGGLTVLDRVRVCTAELDYTARTVIFDGVLTSFQPAFGGGTGRKSFEQSMWFAQDLRYIWAKTQKI